MTGRQRKGGWSWGPVEGAKLRVISNGNGVQSTATILMALHREIGPMPDAIINSDPGDELQGTYRHALWLEQEVARLSNGQVRWINTSKGERLSDSIRRRAEGNAGLRQDGKPNRFVSAPFFTGNGGQGRRQCTREFKVEPLIKVQRGLMGYKPRQRIPVGSCEIWIGFSTDEVVRAGPAFERWAVHRFPLLEQRMSRWDCEQWLRRHGYAVPPKSACIFCPYRSDHEWRWMRDNEPESWAKAVAIDEMIRNTPGMRQREYLHDSRKPLSEVDLSTAEDRGQGSLLSVCEGHCGV